VRGASREGKGAEGGWPSPEDPLSYPDGDGPRAKRPSGGGGGGGGGGGEGFESIFACLKPDIPKTRDLGAPLPSATARDTRKEMTLDLSRVPPAPDEEGADTGEVPVAARLELHEVCLCCG